MKHTHKQIEKGRVIERVSQSVGRSDGLGGDGILKDFDRSIFARLEFEWMEIN